jgi:hypothetical protein
MGDLEETLFGRLEQVYSLCSTLVCLFAPVAKASLGSEGDPRPNRVDFADGVDHRGRDQVYDLACSKAREEGLRSRSSNCNTTQERHSVT